LVSILEQTDANATSPFVVEATGRYVVTTTCQSDELNLLIVAEKAAHLPLVEDRLLKILSIAHKFEYKDPKEDGQMTEVHLE
jgi:hypothetical protein